MSLLDATPRSTLWRDRLALAFQIASLALTGWMLWAAGLAPRWGLFSVEQLILRSALYAFIACAAGAAITLVLYLGAMQWESEDVIRVTLRTCSAAVWFAPAVILLSVLSPGAIAAALVLVVTATRLLYHEWRIQHPPRTPAPRPSGLFARFELPGPAFWRDSAPGLFASFSIQTGVVALLLGKPLLAGIALAMTVALATLFAMTTRPTPARRPQSLPQSILGVLLTIVLAIGLTVAGMMPVWMHGDGSGFGFGSGSGLDGESAKAPARTAPGKGDRTDLPSSAGLADGGFPGVILWPEVKPYATLIAPMPQRADGLSTVENRPMSIPFSGEYWMYRWPFARPPQNSFFQRGTPTALSFKSTDHRPLQMEARHKLEQAIALSCCRMINLDIRNADRFPNTIALELVLINNDMPDTPSVTLGRELVSSLPDLSKEPVRPVAEMLSFVVPSAPRIESFNELKIVFYRDRRRMDQSAKVSIERFVLMPRF